MLFSTLALGIAVLAPSVLSQGPPTPPKYFILQAHYLSGPQKKFDGQYMTLDGSDGNIIPIFSPLNADAPFYTFVNQTTVGGNTYNMAVLEQERSEAFGFLTGQRQAWAEVGFEPVLQFNDAQLQGGWYLAGTEGALTLRYDWQDWNGWLICYWALQEPQLFYMTRNFEHIKLNPGCGLYQLNVVPAGNS